jgi:hypothetical protein
MIAFPSSIDSVNRSCSGQPLIAFEWPRAHADGSTDFTSRRGSDGPLSGSSTLTTSQTSCEPALSYSKYAMDSSGSGAKSWWPSGRGQDCSSVPSRLTRSSVPEFSPSLEFPIHRY